MDDSPPKAAALPTSKKRQTKRLLFDRRYGWVFDEWKEPSEEALVGGRGMFCILPLAKAVANVASESISLVASSTVEVIKEPGLLSPQVLQASLNHQLHKLMSFIRKPEFDFFTHKRSCQSHPTSLCQHIGRS